MTYKFKTEPWAQQRKALLASWNKSFFALLMGYGTGKTKVIIDNAGIQFEQEKSIDALFIIAPNEVHEQWVEEQVPEHLPDRIQRVQRVWTGSNSKKYKKTLEEFWSEKHDGKLKIFSMNVEALQSSPRAKIFAIHFLTSFRTMLAVDESTRIKTPGAKRTKFIINKLSKLAVFKRTLTGNEITRSPFDVYSPYRFLSRDFWRPIPNFHIFTHRYGEWKKNRFPKKSVKVKDFTCPHCLEQPNEILLKKQSDVIFPTCELCTSVIREKTIIDGEEFRLKYPKNLKKVLADDGMFEYPVLIKYRRMEELKAHTSRHSYLVRAEDCQDLPPQIWQPLYTKMNSEQTRVYKELKQELITVYKEEELTVLNKIALTVRFQQIVGGFFPNTNEPIGKTNPKMERMLYDMEDVDCAEPIIIWACFVPEIEGIYKRLREEYPTKKIEKFYGGTAKPDRKFIIQDFKAGEIDYFVANPSVAGTGLNLQTAWMNYYFSNTNKAEDRWQSEKRTHRGEQKHSCVYRDILMKGTVDDTLMRGNKEKKNIAEFFKTNRIFDLV